MGSLSVSPGGGNLLSTKDIASDYSPGNAWISSQGNDLKFKIEINNKKPLTDSGFLIRKTTDQAEIGNPCCCVKLLICINFSIDKGEFIICRCKLTKGVRRSCISGKIILEQETHCRKIPCQEYL